MTLSDFVDDDYVGPDNVARVIGAFFDGRDLEDNGSDGFVRISAVVQDTIRPISCSFTSTDIWPGWVPAVG